MVRSPGVILRGPLRGRLRTTVNVNWRSPYAAALIEERNAQPVK